MLLRRCNSGVMMMINDNSSLVVKALFCDKDVTLPYRFEQMNGFSARSNFVEGCLLRERMEELKMLSKQVKE